MSCHCHCPIQELLSSRGVCPEVDIGCPVETNVPSLLLTGAHYMLQMCRNFLKK